ncbi:universal stress protein family domain-containingprotein [Purpureocillium lavendulum]|uniref:Universal stress protein family domain-containingprotein n=1 Tax=Purpureocillium lavendulum TaxID=1247861 RepID=A0AB34FPW7_9HYPO|nr:universal stress protein family domain-containingprotein [Purpureocillium lavendulum]
MPLVVDTSLPFTLIAALGKAPNKPRKRSFFSIFSCQGSKAFACITDPADPDYGDGRVRRIPHGPGELKPGRRSIGKPAVLQPTMDPPPPQPQSEDSDVSPMTAAPGKTEGQPKSSSETDSTSSTDVVGSDHDVAGTKCAGASVDTTRGANGSVNGPSTGGDYFSPPVAAKDQARVERPVDSGVSMSTSLAQRRPALPAKEPERRVSVVTDASSAAAEPRKLSIAFQETRPRRDSSSSTSNDGSNKSSDAGSNRSSDRSSSGDSNGEARKQSVSSISLRSLSNHSLASGEPRKSSVSFQDVLPKADYSTIDDVVNAWSRKRSISSMSFRRVRTSSTFDGALTPASESQSRPTSPPHPRFQHHVGFDNVPNGEATKNNTLSLTLNVKHKGYQARRRSRTFMVGVDEHSYSDYAIQWLLDELVDDGDEIVCVRVIEKDIRLNDKQYQDDAHSIMDAILARNGANRAVSFVLEYAVGKLHATFQKLIQIYEPAMLIVGTKGRSLGGIQGLVNARNSFSKYCLQYSPVPVVVVRPTAQRIKKKVKRANDSTRQTYVGMLAKTHGRHEADSEASSTYELEIQNTPDEEAHQVAKVLGLPAKFDPTIKPISSSLLRPRSRPTSPHPGTDAPTRLVDASPPSERGDSDDDEDDEEGDFDVIDGQQALTLQQKQEQLHKMEVGEAAALKMRVDDDTDESDEKSDTAQEPKTAS